MLSCLAQSTAHGLGNIGTERHTLGKLMWFLLTIVAMALFIYHTHLLYNQLLEEHVLVATHLDAIPFIQPDIVFCSERLFAKDYINNPPDDEYEYMSNVSETVHQFDNLYRRLDHKLLAYIWDSLSLHQLYKAFVHRRHELFLSLSCNLLPINESSLQVEFNNAHLVCYRLNSSSCQLKTPLDSLVVKFYTHTKSLYNESSPLNVTINGRTLYSYPFAQTKATDEIEDGVNIYFVQPNEGINESTTGLMASVNTHTTVKMKNSKYVRIPTTKSKCHNSTVYMQAFNLLEENRNQNHLNISLESVCIHTFFQYIIHIQLKCVSSQFPIPSDIASNFSFCGNISRFQNMSNYMSLYNDHKLMDPIINHCKLISSCSSIRHQVIVTTTKWPQLSALKSLFHKDIPKKLLDLKKRNLSSPGLSEAANHYNDHPSDILRWRKNFIKVSIIPSEFRSTFFEESSAYSFKNFFSDVGGIMGFYMGASVLTICELFRLIHYTIQTIMRPKKKELETDI